MNFLIRQTGLHRFRALTPVSQFFFDKRCFSLTAATTDGYYSITIRVLRIP
jgi:hypothetical protein